MTYREIVFMQGEEASAIIDRLGRVDGVVYRGHTDETVAEAVRHLSQLDIEDDGPLRAGGGGTFGDSVVVEHDGYVLTWAPLRDYIGLFRPIARSWADGFGAWHTALPGLTEDRDLARRIICTEIMERDRHADPDVIRVRFERFDRITHETIYREVL